MSRTRSLFFVACAAAFFLTVTVARASGVDPARISLPKGPGSVEGLATRDFAPSLSTGASSYDLPIAVPPASAGFGPALSLAYDSGGGVTEIGIGWRVAGAAKIRRRVADGLPRFDDTDTFELVGIGSGAELLEVAPGTFRPRYEDGSFARVTRAPSGSDWEARTKGGVTCRFGGDEFTEAQGTHVAAYLLREQVDRHGHRIAYEWDRSEGHALLDRVSWNDFSADARNEIRFTYEARPDGHRRFSSGILETLTRRLHSVEVKHGGALVRRYELSYGDGAHPVLAKVEMVGTDGVTRLPPAHFEYTEAKLSADASQLVTMESPPGRSLSDRDSALLDLDGDGLPDLLIAEAGRYRSYTNRDGKQWSPPADFDAGASPSVSLSTVGVQIADLDADGAPDLLVKSGKDDFRYFPRPEGTRWGAPVALPTVPSFSFEDPNVRLADMDGDRRTDVVLTTESGIFVSYNVGGQDFTEPLLAGTMAGRETPLFADGHTELCDVNGDRVEDLCVLRSGALTYYLGMGHGLFDEPGEGASVPTWDASAPYRPIDLNGDGWMDLVRVGVHGVSYALAIGEAHFADVITLDGTPEKLETTAVEFADMNASGTTDIVWADVTGTDSASYRYLELFPDGRAGLLRRIDNGLGKVQTIEYAPAVRFAAAARDAGSPWTSRINLAMPVVTRVAVDTSLGDPIVVTETTYRDGAYDPAERTFAGFARGLRRQLGDGWTKTLVTEDTFDTGLTRRVLRGMLLSEETRDESGTVFSRTWNEPEERTLQTALDGRAVEYAFKRSERVEHVEGAPLAERSTTTLTEYEEDEYGNVTREKRWGEVVGSDGTAGSDETFLERSFANDPDEWLLGFVATEEVTDARGTRVALARKYYDGAPFMGLALGQVTRGDVTREEAWVGPARDTFELVTGTRYEEDGLPAETRDGRGGGRLFEWAEDHTTLRSEQVLLESGVSLVEAADTDPAFGTLRSVTGYDGETTRFEYDALARLVKVEKPGDTAALPTVTYAYQVAAPLSRVVTTARRRSGHDDVDVSETLFDGAGRERGTLTRDGDRWVLAGVSLEDARGTARRTLLPRWVTEEEHSAPPLQVDTPRGSDSYRDALGREIRTRSASGIETRTLYRPLEKRHWDGGQADDSSPYEHVPSVELVDGQGRPVAHVRTLGGKALEARYTYDAAGSLLSRADPEGNVGTYAYDGRGRRTAVHDPDLGDYGFAFDGTGNVTARTYPDGTRATFTFDLAGRSLTEDWNGDGEPEVTRTWDRSSGASDPLLLGKLARTVEPSGSVEHGYDARGRVTATHYAIGDVTYTVGSEYDAQDRETLHVYPDGSSLEIRRNARGQIEGYGKAFELHYGEDGLEQGRRFSTGVTVTSVYDDDRRRTDFEMKSASGKTLESLHFSYDAAGNPTKLEDRRERVSPRDDRTESYTYDNLYRLSGAQGAWGHTTWRFSPSGNLLGRDSSVPEEQLTRVDYTSTLHAPRAFDARPIRYDARGRMQDDGKRAYTWNEADQLVRVVGTDGATVDSTYAADGVRRTRVEHHADGTRSTTHFIDAWSEVKDGKLVRYIVHGGQRIVRLAEGNGVRAALPALAGRVSGSSAPFAHDAPWLATLGMLAVLLLKALGRRCPMVVRVSAVGVVALLATAGCGGGPLRDGSNPMPPLALFLVGLLTLVALALFLRDRSVRAFDSIVPRGSRGPALAPPVYSDLRGAVLGGSPAAFGLSPPTPDAPVWGVVMETRFPEAVVTLVALSDGSASLYCGSGGGVIGGGAHESVHHAATSFVHLAAQFLRQLGPTTETPLPGKGRTVFYVRTASGTFTAEDAENTLGDERSRLSPLFHAGHGVIAPLLALSDRGERGQ